MNGPEAISQHTRGSESDSRSAAIAPVGIFRRLRPYFGPAARVLLPNQLHSFLA